MTIISTTMTNCDHTFHIVDKCGFVLHYSMFDQSFRIPSYPFLCQFSINQMLKYFVHSNLSVQKLDSDM